MYVANLHQSNTVTQTPITQIAYIANCVQRIAYMIMCYKIQADRAGYTRHRPGPTELMLGPGFKRQPEIKLGSMLGHTLAQFLQAGPGRALYRPGQNSEIQAQARPGPARCQVCSFVMEKSAGNIQISD
jgi:hypothetical protein